MNASLLQFILVSFVILFEFILFVEAQKSKKKIDELMRQATSGRKEARKRGGTDALQNPSQSSRWYTMIQNTKNASSTIFPVKMRCADVKLVIEKMVCYSMEKYFAY